MPGQNPVFRAGYNYAADTYSLRALPINILVDMIDAYKQMALDSECAYYLGIARRVEDEIGLRTIGEGEGVA